MNIYAKGSVLACILALLASLALCTKSAAAENTSVDVAYNTLLGRLSLKIRRQNRIALNSVWQTNAPDWRWRMQALACDPTEHNSDAMHRTLRSGFANYLESMNEQLNLSSMMNQNIDFALAQKLSQDLIYMAYLSSAKGYSKAYIQRLNILFRYYPKLKKPMCEVAFEQVKSVPDVYPNKVARLTTSDEISANKVLMRAYQDMALNMRYGAQAYWLSMKNHYQVNDAHLYSVLQKDRKSFDMLSHIASGVPLRTEYHQALYEIHQGQQEPKIKYRHSVITDLALVLNRKMYALATLSALSQTLLEYEQHKQPIVEHMQDYVQRAIDKVTSAEYQSHKPGLNYF